MILPPHPASVFPGTSSRRAPVVPASSGFTLVELMVVVAILMGIMTLVPTNLYRWGARSRLENGANTLVAAVSASRSQAILDGYPVKLEFGKFRDVDGETHYGHRWVVTSLPAEHSDMLNRDDDDDDDGRSEEREWVTTYWDELPQGVIISGISEQGESWKEIPEDRPYSVTFGPDGSVERGFALRLEAEDLELDKEDRTITVVVNPLTAEAASYDGYRDVAKQREEHEFSK